jgi:hypothetical protein
LGPDDREFVAGMEGVLDTYTQPYDAARPVVCMNEQPIQLLKETRMPTPAHSNANQRAVDWQSKVGDARLKPKLVYPKIVE